MIDLPEINLGFDWFWYLFLIPPVVLIIAIIISFFIAFSKAVKKYGELPPTPKEFKRPLWLKRFFIDFPQQFWHDRFHHDPEEFSMSGTYLFTGEQGAGKTMAMTEFIFYLQKKNPKMKVYTNYNYKFEDKPFLHWKNLSQNGYENGKYGRIIAIDEIQNWFKSGQRETMPPEFLQEISQERKQRTIIVGTCQRFAMLNKRLREQTHFLYRPFTIAGCLTVVRISRPVIDYGGEIKKHTQKRMYFFVHNAFLRNAYDTYLKIKTLSDSGFSEDKNE